MLQRFCILLTIVVASACSRVDELPVVQGSCNENDWHCNLDAFQQLPIEGKLHDASAIILAKNTRAKDGSIVERVEEVIKLRPGTTLYLTKGETYKVHRDTSDYGEGSVVLLRGSPAAFVESYSYADGSIRSLGHMPMAIFRNLATNAAADQLAPL